MRTSSVCIIVPVGGSLGFGEMILGNPTARKGNSHKSLPETSTPESDSWLCA